MDPEPADGDPAVSHLSSAEAHRLSAFAPRPASPERQILIKQGDYSTELITIEEGTADVIRNGEKVALEAGDMIGEMGLLTREPRNADVIATSPMRVIKLTHWEIRRMSEETIISERALRSPAPPADGRRAAQR